MNFYQQQTLVQEALAKQIQEDREFFNYLIEHLRISEVSKQELQVVMQNSKKENAENGKTSRENGRLSTEKRTVSTENLIRD